MYKNVNTVVCMVFLSMSHCSSMYLDCVRWIGNFSPASRADRSVPCFKRRVWERN